MSKLAVIATLYGERGAANWPRMRAALAAQTRRPDELWIMAEAVPFGVFEGFNVIHLPTPRDANGRYAEIPYSRKINHVLDDIARRTSDMYIAYLTDDSLPHPEKYERMARALDEHPEWGAVWCGQRRNGTDCPANAVMDDAHCKVDHTQVMHRLTADRWPLDVRLIKLGDAEFWRALHRSLGAFYPVEGILDETTQTRDGISATY